MLKKEDIEKAFQNMDLEDAKSFLIQYEQVCPDDLEITAMWTNYYLLIGNLEEAKVWAEKGIKISPLTADLQYNLAYVYELLGEYVQALYYYHRARVLYEYMDDPKVSEVIEKENQISDELSQMDYAGLEESERRKLLQQIIILQNMLEKDCGLSETAFRTLKQSVGKYYYINMSSKRFIGILKDVVLTYLIQDEANMDLLHIKGEFLEVIEDQNMEVTVSGGVEDDILIPVASSKPDNVLRFGHGEDTYEVIQYQPFRFQYYRVKNHSVIHSLNNSYFGKPILLKSHPDKKRLVLSIFVDGLANRILKEDDFRKNMPYTYEFFKSGTIFDRAYCTGEWTYPSIASIISGLDTTRHRMIHPRFDLALPDDIPTIGEYFHDEGYYTSMLGGNWRIIPAYGFARGIDRYVYQNANSGYKVHEVIADAIDHMMAFRDVNQYIWLSVGDLHDVADGLALPVDVQGALPLDKRIFEDKGETSVKQEYSENKTEQFRCQARHVDYWLHILYNYLNENYKEDEIVISLFADHGQGFLVPDEEHFLSEGRSNVAFMFRGGDAKGKGIVDEVVSTLDYGYILRHLAGIQGQEVKTDGRLPQIFQGSEEREYAITESIHPGDPYQAAIFGKYDSFYFRNSEPVQDDGRFILKEYSGYVITKDGQREEKGDRVNYYMDIIMKHIAPLMIYN